VSDDSYTPQVGDVVRWRENSPCTVFSHGDLARVLVVVHSCESCQGHDSGVIVEAQAGPYRGKYTYPFVWDPSRFELVERRPKSDVFPSRFPPGTGTSVYSQVSRDVSEFYLSLRSWGESADNDNDQMDRFWDIMGSFNR
jgi:hypothetical protein